MAGREEGHKAFRLLPSCCCCCCCLNGCTEGGGRGTAGAPARGGGVGGHVGDEQAGGI